jgi:5'-AMP-activated protein kinase regulatory beta subunit
MDEAEQRELRRLERTLSKKGSNNTIQRNTNREDMTKKATQKAAAKHTEHAAEPAKPAVEHKKPAAEPSQPHAAHPTADKNEPAKSPAADRGAPTHEEGRKKDAQQHVTQMSALNNEQPHPTENSENSPAVESVRQLQQQVQDHQQDAGPENQKVNFSEVHFVCPFEGNACFIAGTFNNWNFQPLSRGANGKYELAMRLPAGTYFYKYIIDGDWKYDSEKPISSDSEGYENNVLVIP